MPTYDFECKYCGSVFEKRVAYEERNMVSCRYCEKETIVLPCAPRIGDAHHLGIKKPPSDFDKYVLSRIKEKHPGNTIENRRSLQREI